MNRYIIVSWLLLLAMMVLTVGCRDDEGNDPRQKAIVELVPSVSSYTDIEPITRATSPTWAPNGYYLYDDLTGVNGVLMSNTGAQWYMITDSALTANGLLMRKWKIPVNTSFMVSYLIVPLRIIALWNMIILPMEQP